jgi:hypothetical protein
LKKTTTNHSCACVLYDCKDLMPQMLVLAASTRKDGHVKCKALVTNNGVKALHLTK